MPEPAKFVLNVEPEHVDSELHASNRAARRLADACLELEDAYARLRRPEGVRQYVREHFDAASEEYNASLAEYQRVSRDGE